MVNKPSPESTSPGRVARPLLRWMTGNGLTGCGPGSRMRSGGLESQLRMLEGQPSNLTRFAPIRDRLPMSILKLLRQIAGAANGASNTPPRMQVSTAFGVVTLEAGWLVRAGVLPEDVASDPKSCLISVTMELREHPIAHTARVLRENGATPAQMKAGIQLALGKTKPMIANELGI